MKLRDWLFKRSFNTIGNLLSFVIIFSALQFIDYNLIKDIPLFFLPLMIIIFLVFNLLDSLFNKLLGYKNKVIGTGYFVIVIFIFWGINLF
jgi:hypothetical protein